MQCQCAGVVEADVGGEALIGSMMMESFFPSFLHIDAPSSHQRHPECATRTVGS